MSRLTLIWGLLLLAGIFKVDIYVESSMSAPVQSTSPKAPESSNRTIQLLPITITQTSNTTTTQAPSNTTSHTTSNTTTHAPSNTTHTPSNTTTHTTSNTTTHAPSNTTHTPSNTTTHTTSNTTTHAPSNTTHTPSNTTTHTTSNTTTHASNTTHTPSNTTTHAPSNTTHTPSNTTSHSPSNTTTHPTTHTTPVLPTKPSPPITGNYTVKDANGTCIIADMGLELELDNSTKTKGYFNVKPKETNAKGTCGDSRANLLLEFPEGSINFVFVKESKIYYIDEVSVTFSWRSTEKWSGTATKLKLLSTDIGYFAKCTNTPTVKLTDNIRLTMADVKLQAFDIQKGVLGKEAVCSYDRNVIAVAVGVTVVIVAIIAIIIYFIWHKKRSSGYQRI